MNGTITSREAILQVCRNIVAQQGIAALNMRTVAKECHIALGTLYNYFADKDALLFATVESIWKEIFHMDQRFETDLSFPDYIAYIFDCVQQGAAAYPNFLTDHSISIAKGKKDKAKSTMEHYLAHMKAGLRKVLEADDAVADHVFSAAFTESDFIDFVLDHMLLLLVAGRTSCATLVELIRRILYR